MVWRSKLLLCSFRFGGFGLGGVGFGVLAAEALDATGGVHQLLLAGKERVAGGADFHVDIALVGRAGKRTYCRTRNGREFLRRRDGWLPS